MTVRLLEERRFDPPRAVEVERDGHWWPGFQRAWQLCDNGRGWMGDVQYSVRYDWVSVSTFSGFRQAASVYPATPPLLGRLRRRERRSSW